MNRLSIKLVGKLIVNIKFPPTIKTEKNLRIAGIPFSN